jgi:hypothetical protein
MIAKESLDESPSPEAAADNLAYCEIQYSVPLLMAAFGTHLVHSILKLSFHFLELLDGAFKLCLIRARDIMTNAVHCRSAKGYSECLNRLVQFLQTSWRYG